MEKYALRSPIGLRRATIGCRRRCRRFDEMKSPAWQMQTGLFVKRSADRRSLYGKKRRSHTSHRQLLLLTKLNSCMRESPVI